MRKSTKKSFDWYGMRQHFSIRKYHFGAASVLLGMSLVLGAGAQVAQAETSASSSVVVATTSSSETVPTETVASSTTEAVVTEATVASTTETVATTARTATINYIVQYVAEDGSVVKADVLSTTVNTTETTATTSVSVTAEVPTGYVLPTGQTAVVTQAVTENAINLLTVKVVKNAEEKAIETTATTTEKPAETTVTETKPEAAGATEEAPTASTETAAAKSTEEATTTTATVAETVKTPATVEEAKVVLEQVTSEAEVLANESERLVAASDKENTALKAAAAATKLTATEATAVLNDSTATLEAVNSQIDAVRTNVEALALELRKFLGTDLIQVALTTTTDMNNASGHNGVWTENETVTNKEEAVKTATTSASLPDIPAGYLADPTDGRLTFMIYHLSGDQDSNYDGTKDAGSFNLRMGTDYYMVLSVNRDKSKGESIYVNIFDKATNKIAVDANGNVAPEVEVPIGSTKSIDFLNNLAKTKEIAKKYNFTVNVNDTTLTNDAGEAFVYRVLQIRNGVGGSGRQTIVYSTQTTSRESYNNFTGTAPINDPIQTTYYYVKATTNREEELLAKYIQIGDIVTDSFTIPSAATFDNYELIEKPASESGTLGTNFVQGASIISYYPGSLQARVQYISKKDGTSRFLQFVLNPDHDDLFANVNTYSKYTQTTFQDVANEVLRLDERVALAEQVEADIAAVNADTSLTNEQKEAKIKRIRDAGSVQANSVDDIFLLAFTGQEVPPQGYNNDADVITGLTTWNYTSSKYKFRDRRTGTVYDSIQGFLTEYSGNPLALRSFPNESHLILIDKNVTESPLRGDDANRYDIINPLTNSNIGIQAIQLSMFNGLAHTDSERAYYYAEKGGLKVYYVDTEGTVIKDENFVMPHENTDTPYNTDTEEVKPETITYKGEVYYYKEIDKISDNSLVPASQNTETEKRTIEKIDQETGVIEQDTLKELTYVYEKAGNVNINYVDTDGVPLRNKVIDVENGKPGSDYNTAQNKSEKPDTITTDDGTVYHLVPAGDYPVGKVSDNNNLTKVGNGTATGIDPVTGTVVSNVTKEITYVYQKAGNVNINYVDTDGNVLQPKLADVTNGKPDSTYNTADNKTEKPDTITTEDGTVYYLVPKGTYNVGEVSDNNNLTTVGNGKATGIDPVTGKVVADETKEITYVYQPAGNVNVNYVDTKGNVIKDKVADEVNEPAGTDYDTVVDNKPEKITTEDGKVYYLAPAATYEVGTVSDDNNLTSVGNGTATGIDPITGDVVAGETKEITYVYQEAGNVNINYVDTEGNVIKLPVTDTVNGKPGTDYDTTESSTTKNEKPTEILYDGKLYKLVPAGTYNVGTVGESNNLTAVGNGEATGIDPITGEVVAGETKEITYVYELVTGNVVITYVDTEGNVLKSEVKDTTDKEPGTPYDTKEGDNEYPSTIEKDGETYYRVEEAGNHTVGNTTEDGHLVSSDDPSGTVEEGTKTVTYVYQKAGNVNVNYVDTDGKVLKAKVADVVNGKPGSDYDTVIDNKPATITTEDGKTYKLVPAGSYKVGVVGSNNNLTEVGNGEATGIDPVTGDVVAGETKEITYVYQLVTGNVVITYIDTEGNPLKSEVKDSTDAPVGDSYNTKDNDNEYPSTIEKDGETYYRVEAGNHTVGETTEDGHLVSSDKPEGTVEEGTKTVTYVYQKAGNVNVNYVDTEGKVLKDKVADVVNGKPGSDYNTVVDNKPTEILYDGKLYRLVPAGTYNVGTVGESNDLTTVGNGKATGIDPVTGDVVAGETKEITYVYKLVTGNVVITYVDTDDNVLKSEVKDTTDKEPGTPYDTKEGDKEYPSSIEKDGETYYRVEKGEHKVGETTEDGHLVSSDKPEGEVEEGTKTVTYVYQKAGNVNINYVDTEGKPLQAPVSDTVNGKPGTDYDTTESSTTKTEKPDTITTADGKVYKLVPAGDYPVGNVSDDNNLTSVGNGEATGIDPITGEVVAGETKEITYVYKLVTGNVVITYVDTEGNVLKSEVKDTTDQEPGTPYDTKEGDNEYPSTIEKDGETYYRVEAGNHTVGNTTEDGHLVSSDDPKGTVEEGTKTVTYVYEKAGNVNVNYVDTDGKVLKAKVADVVNGKPGSDYDTVIDNKPATITTEDGKTYKLVPAGSYKVGVVGSNNNLTEVGNGEATGIDSVTGDVVAGETKEITYVYELVTGSVVARYVIEGTETEIADDKTVKPKETPVDEVYGDTPPPTITKDGKTYILVRTREKEGDAPKDGKVIEGEQTITYEYKEVEETPEVKSGNVNVNYVDTEGNVIKDKVADVVNEPAGTDYDTVVDNKPTTITKDGKTYKLVPSGSYNVGVVGSNNNLIEVGNGKAKGTDPVIGDVVADETKEITYVYQLVTGSVVARYVIEGTEDEIADDKSVKPKDTPVDEVYGDTPPTTITKDGKKYILVRTREKEGDAPKDGKVIEGEQTITYEYKEVKETPEVKSGNVVITYVDTEGNPLKSEVKDTTDGEVGSEYNTKENDNEYPETIVKDGVTYKRVKAGNHTVGETTEDGHLVSSDKPAGTVEEGTKTVTYVYEKVTGSVVARYVIEGTETEIADDKTVKPKETPVDEVYGDTPPTTITKDGKKYILVRTRENEGDAPKDGKVIEGEQTITYEYKEVKETPEVKSGNVVITYVDTEGNPLKSEVKDTTDGEVGSEYNTKESDNEYPETIVKDGVTYKRVKAGNHTVGETTEDGHLVSSDKPAGTVEEGTKTVTYVYEKVTGSVVARYVIEGTETEIADDTTVKPKETPVDEVYGDTPPTTITKDGKTYILVRTRENEGDAPKDGKVIEGEQTITYEYKEVVDNVVITYVDTFGNVLKELVKDTTGKELGTPYDTKQNDNEYPLYIVKGDAVYRRVLAGNFDVGVTTEDGHLVSSDAVDGVVEEGTKVVTYVYELVKTPTTKTGSVVARYVIEGTETEIADDTTVKPKETPIDEVYGDTPPLIIEKNGKKYILVRTRTNEGDAPENGVVVEGEQVITYEYKELEENPTPVPPTPRPNPGRPGTPVPPAPGKPAKPASPAKAQLPNTGETSSVAGVFGVAMLVAALALVGKRRRKED